MIGLTTTVCLAAVLVPGYSGHGRAESRVVCCDVCGVETAEVAALIQTMQTCPRWRKRDNAAHALRRFDWRCHPEAAQALAATMLRDCEEEVREEAAESLAKMKPCLPEVHASLAQAARCDPDHATRKWARRGIEAIGDRCVAQCDVCGVDSDLPVRYLVPTRVNEIRTAPSVRVMPYEPPVAPPAVEVLPPADLPPMPEVDSPFLVPAETKLPDDRSATRKEPASVRRLTLGRILRPGAAR